MLERHDVGDEVRAELLPRRAVGDEVALEQIWRNPQAVVAVGRHLVFAGANRTYAVYLHEPANTALADSEASFL